jgi:hypothetical protein
MAKLSNRIKTTVDIHLNGYERIQAFRWLNVQHTGKESMPVEVKCSAKHQDAGYALCRVNRVEIELELKKNGTYKVVKVGGKKVK